MIEIFTQLWNLFLFEPVFNLLIWFYNNWAGQNLGWAVVLLTVSLRLALLPLTIINERNKAKNENLKEEIEKIEKDFKEDPVLKKQKIRETLQEKRIRPWAKAASLAVQVLVLVILYQVFLYGISGNRVARLLYPSVVFPGDINTIFFGFDLASSYSILWSSVVAIWLLVDVYWDVSQDDSIEKKDLFYLIAFPLAAFVLLYLFPIVKALFILTSMAFTLITSRLIKPLFIPNSSE